MISPIDIVLALIGLLIAGLVLARKHPNRGPRYPYKDRDRQP